MATFKVSYAFVMDPKELTTTPPTMTVELPDDEPTLLQVKRAVREATPARQRTGQLVISGVERVSGEPDARG